MLSISHLSKTYANGVRALDDVHPEVRAREVGDGIAVGDPERDVIERVDGQWRGHSLHATHRGTPPYAP